MAEDTRLAVVAYSEDAGVWRLRLDPSPDHHPQGKLIELPGFSGDLHDQNDWEKINLALGSWGVTYDFGAWRDFDGGWVVPVFQQR
ncbi:hypothetical protein ASD11_15090 [Aeromicrobium sp. Root495]|uniref:hypothetical protein n=1 Tax=Aeromicrobium sp. Root495 TaxID=1736550 RepID=UPI000713BD61|nr:hypothetical protein [Aeromicrobium sp. Root495]KQY55827.1 hypothetical protein ASD11_15090 [Aeromicrobium sp. Root495]